MSQQATMVMVRNLLRGLRNTTDDRGMARIFLCAPSLASYILDGEWDPDMPESFKITPKRIERLKQKVGDMNKKDIDAESRLTPALKKVTI